MQESKSDSSIENDIAEIESIPTKVEEEKSDNPAESNPESVISDSNTAELD